MPRQYTFLPTQLPPFPAKLSYMGIEPGDGSALKPVSGWQWLWRGQFLAELDGHCYAVDVDYLDWDEKSVLYRDGLQVAVGGNPARFELPGGAAIETRMSSYGMSRVHLVHPGGAELLRPAPGTGEEWRAHLHRNRPGLSRTLAAVSFTVLLAALLLELPQLVQWLTGTGWWQAVSGWRFSSPASLSATANVVLTGAGVLAGLERALRVRHDWWLDD